MSNKLDKVEELVAKLKDIEIVITEQEREVISYMAKLPLTAESTTLLVAHIKSLRTSIELLREEIDELHQVVVTLKD